MAQAPQAPRSTDTADGRLRCTVFVGSSIDGFIARRDGALDFLDGPPGDAGSAGADAPTGGRGSAGPGAVPGGDDTAGADGDAGPIEGRSASAKADDAVDDSGYEALLDEIDVLVMGRSTYDVVADLVDLATDWPWPVPVVVLTTRPLETPTGADVRTMAGTVTEVAAAILAEGWRRAYVDGGVVARQFLAADLVDRVTVTTVPVLIGDGVRLFGDLDGDRWFTADEPRLLAGGLVQTTWHRVR